MHGAGIGLNGLLQWGAAFRAFPAQVAGTFLVYRATEQSRRMRFNQRHVALRALVAFFARYFRVHRAGITAVAWVVFGSFTGCEQGSASQQQKEYGEHPFRIHSTVFLNKGARGAKFAR